MSGVPGPLPHLWIVGPGRVGLSLGALLDGVGAVERLTFSGRRASPPEHPLFAARPPRAAYLAGPLSPPDDAAATAVLLCVPDREIPGAAAALADAGVGPGAVVLHVSGALGLDALEPLSRAGSAVGSIHPLVALPDPLTGEERLRGAWFGVEGEGDARVLAEGFVSAAGGRTLPVAAGEKPAYHAAAVFASNYVVALLSVAERLMERAGVPAEEARPALASLAAGAVADAAGRGPRAALTGPVSRGDAETVRLHLARLFPGERGLYSLLAREALALARARGLGEPAAQGVEDALEEGG